MKSYAQDGEDILLDHLIGDQKRGVYVDIGAADYYSNTQFFRERGWRGVNVEPHPESYERIIKNRPDDFNMQAGVAEEEGLRTFYAVKEHRTRSTFNKAVADNCGFPYETITIAVMPLRDILAAAGVGAIDLMSIDTEGHDFQVLRSNNWKRWVPKFIIIEIKPPNGLDKEPWEGFLESKGYRLAAVSKNHINAIYQHKP